jgi:hypothetical protein
VSLVRFSLLKAADAADGGVPPSRKSRITKKTRGRLWYPTQAKTGLEWGTQPSLLKGKTADPSASLGMTKERVAPHLDSGGGGWTESIGTYLSSSSDPGAEEELPIKPFHQYREQVRWVYTGWRFWNGGLRDHILNSLAELRRRIILHDTGAFSQLVGGGGYKLLIALDCEGETVFAGQGPSTKNSDQGGVTCHWTLPL